MASASTRGRVGTPMLAGSTYRRTKRASASTLGPQRALSMKGSGKETKRQGWGATSTQTRVYTLAFTTMTSRMVLAFTSGLTETSTKVNGRTVFGAASVNLNSPSETLTISVNSGPISSKAKATSSTATEPITRGVSGRTSATDLARAHGQMEALMSAFGRMAKRMGLGG